MLLFTYLWVIGLISVSFAIYSYRFSYLLHCFGRLVFVMCMLFCLFFSVKSNIEKNGKLW